MITHFEAQFFQCRMNEKDVINKLNERPRTWWDNFVMQ